MPKAQRTKINRTVPTIKRAWQKRCGWRGGAACEKRRKSRKPAPVTVDASGRRVSRCGTADDYLYFVLLNYSTQTSNLK